MTAGSARGADAPPPWLPAHAARVRDPARLATLRALSLDAGHSDDAFDRLSRLAARFVGAPAALVNVVESDRQVTRSAYGDPERFQRGDVAALEDSICRFGVVTGEPLVIPDTAADPRSAGTACVAAGVGSYAGVPLTLSSGHTIGSLCVLDDRPRAWTDAELSVLTDLASAAVTELELLAATRAAEGRAAAEASARRLRAVLTISDTALNQATLDETLAAILDRLRGVLAADSATVLLVEPDGQSLRVRASLGLEGEVAAGVRIPLGRGIAGRIAARREPLIVPDVAAADPASPILAEKVRSLLGAPLLLDDALLGVVHVGTTTPRAFQEDDVRLLELAAGRIAMAVERARLFDAEREARLAAEAASRAKTEFLAVMSHELRTPLNAIGGYAQLLAEEVLGPVPAEQRELLRRIHAGQQRLARLIDDILQIVDLDRHGPRDDAEDAVLADVLDAVDAAAGARAAEQGIAYESVRCPAAAVAAPREALVDILTRVVDNALKFTPAGGRVTVRCEAADGRVAVSVTDTGPGIPAEQMAAIFEPFGRVDSSYRRAHEGAGLGLAIARGRARRLGGDLAADRPADGGTRITLTLPERAG